MDSSVPISALVRPRATSAEHLRPRAPTAVGGAGARTWRTRVDATVGASTVSPRAAARTASASSAGGRVLEQVAGRAGLDRAQDVRVGLVGGEHDHPGPGGGGEDLPGGAAPRRRPASAGPSAPRPAQLPAPAATASAPDAASPTTSRSGSAASMPRSPCRTTGWSSTSTPDAGHAPAPPARSVARVRAAVHRQSPCARSAAAPACPRSPNPPGRGAVESAAVVADRQPHRVRAVGAG